MIKAIILAVALCCALPAGAAERPAPTGADLHDRLPREKRPVQLAANEAMLSKALEVSSPDPGIDDADQLPPSDDFELKLPEQELPQSDIPLTFNDKVAYFIKYFQTDARGAFSRWLSRSERYIPMMRGVLRKEGLPEDLVYLAMIESGFSPQAYSVARAVGPWQFMSETGRNYSLRIDSSIDERRDPLKSTVAAAMYLKELYALFNKDWYLAAAGYNAGENKILRAINMYNSRDFWELSKGEYLKRETKDYVPKLLAAAIIAKEPAKYGFADVAYLPPIVFDTAQIPSRTDLRIPAKICGVSARDIKELNPELLRSSTPPDFPGYQLKIPKGCGSIFETAYAKVPEEKRYTERVKTVHYRVKKKETLATVAKRFGTTTEVLAEANNLSHKTKLRGRTLKIPIVIPADELDETPSVKAAVAKAQGAEPARASRVASVKYYIVKKGDTLFSLAKRFNVTTKLLAGWNNMKSHMALRPGKKLIVAKLQQKTEG
ncbi:lytic transglycosylase domain-containing protein [Geomesophilobacter sediminis]|uniref:LysM peptidoglycan-binding domain-containing protein n=1 Tax=Geomesophilobacter sediminis TaxID=2798584 RepID=A0A8J7M124_9BACT|nr:lytic transglycosylase domain-containing protein [Geomesophilobacter sediminis]MBJ6726646.1 LysM peptidoglycan-binding domain-containing protein [Geomesophilobacter sediminis]